MKNKNKGLMKTWDIHGESMENRVPTKEEIEDPRDFIYQWLLEVENKKSKRLLDDGCGIGQYVSGTRILGFKAEGIDISKKSVEKGVARGEKIIQGDMRNLPYKDKTFDIIIAGGSMEHFPETNKALSEISRVIKNNGLFLFNVPYRYTLYVIIKKIQQLFGIWKCGYEKSFSIKQIQKKLDEFNFEIVEMKKSEIKEGKAYPKISGLLSNIDKKCIKIGFGGHHLWFKCIKKKDV